MVKPTVNIRLIYRFTLFTRFRISATLSEFIGTSDRPYYITLFAKGFTNGVAANPNSNYGLVLRDSANAAWKGCGNDNTNTDQNTGTHTPAYQTEMNNIITSRRDNVIGVGQFAIAKSGVAPLSLKFTKFNIKTNNNIAELEWEVIADEDVDSYIIEACSNGKDWATLAKVDEANC
jgi:hypothetical protein